MININAKEWNELTVEDVEVAVANLEESFYFEFKEDKVLSKKLAGEISAFANTYGGYIFLGITDRKEIEGCEKWNEQSIHAMIHDALSPTPDFDVKKFETKDGKIILIIKVEQGSEPPYITSQGKIYERLSSGSFVINDSTKLTQMYYKRENELKRIEEKLKIEPIEMVPNNVFGYLDVGFSIRVTNFEEIWDKFIQADLKTMVHREGKNGDIYSISKVGRSLVIGLGKVQNPDGFVQANLYTFAEILGDGSVKLRILLYNNDGSDDVNICQIINALSIFRDTYLDIFGEHFDELFLSAYKYEKLTVLKQFSPILFLEGDSEEGINKKFREIYDNHKRNYSNNWIIAGDRIPKCGLKVLDKRYFSRMEVEYNSEGIIEELFRSQYGFLGYIDLLNLGQD